MIIFDTAPLVALTSRRDNHRPRLEALLRSLAGGRYGQWLSTDYVLDEGLTLIQARWRDRAAATQFATLFHGAKDAREPVVGMRATSADVIEEAVELYFRHWDRGLSLTDCTLLVHARRVDAVLATFDKGFDGLVATVG